MVLLSYENHRHHSPLSSQCDSSSVPVDIFIGYFWYYLECLVDQLLDLTFCLARSTLNVCLVSSPVERILEADGVGGSIPSQGTDLSDKIGIIQECLLHYFVSCS